MSTYRQWLSKRNILLITVITTIPVAIALFYNLRTVQNFHFTNITPSIRQSFSSEIWKRAEDMRNPSVRSWMLEDLRSKHNLKGFKRTEIIELLGRPRQMGMYNFDDYNYALGSNSNDFMGFPQRRYLLLQFKNDVVCNVILSDEVD